MRKPAAHLPLAVLVASAAALPCAQAQTPPAGGGKAIYTCTTADGRKLTGDRPIADCNTREQRVLNADGSLRSVLPPSMSIEEKAAKEALDRKLAVERATQADAVRRDRNLVQRFPNEAAHKRARDLALDDVNTATRNSERRLQDLAAERKPLSDEAEFYVGKPLPPKLKLMIDANDAAAEAQRVLIENQKSELVRINRNFDLELARLRRLWAGAAYGSLEAPSKPASH
ncbi:hypothetical protein [Pelomonas sp. SE-A7]|uniref:hypothetical protein n=1 Tax=Pelomonas sp. SE-A7 TaxID=3054953 RepID=UPI00259C8323|nr:hypothetical protein [Pelomonas sp. SE-A7]MDM4767081.1 hypothetical protein [Pelomonas sp. SE-A7]